MARVIYPDDEQRLKETYPRSHPPTELASRAQKHLNDAAALIVPEVDPRRHETDAQYSAALMRRVRQIASIVEGWTQSLIAKEELRRDPNPPPDGPLDAFETPRETDRSTDSHQVEAWADTYPVKDEEVVEVELPEPQRIAKLALTLHPHEETIWLAADIAEEGSVLRFAERPSETLVVTKEEGERGGMWGYRVSRGIGAPVGWEPPLRRNDSEVLNIGYAGAEGSMPRPLRYDASTLPSMQEQPE